MDIPFHKIQISDRQKILSYTLESPYQNCDYSFANLYNWSHLYKTEVAFHKEMMIIRFLPNQGTRPAALLPVGPGNLEEVLQDLSKCFELHGYPLTLMAVTQKGLEKLREIYPEGIHVLENRDYSDYIYLRETLEELSGKKLQSKRNHINKFLRLYPDYSYEEISEKNIPECLDLEELWFKESEQTEEILTEKEMVLKALRHASEIGLRGGCLRVEGRIVAFTLGMPINHETFGVSVEKADVSVEGSFTMINREFVRHLPPQFKYINREEDLGLEGLRKSKLSYQPHLILDKNTVLIRNS